MIITRSFGGGVVGKRDWTQLQIQWAKVRIYSQGTGWELVDKKSPGEGWRRRSPVDAKGDPVWRVVRYQGWGFWLNWVTGFLLKFGSWEHAQGQGLIEKEIRGASLEFGQGMNLSYFRVCAWQATAENRVSDRLIINRAVRSHFHQLSVSTFDNGDER